MSVVLETTVGDLTIDLYTKARPNTCKNFLKLCKVKYYNLCLFHSVQRDFLAQTGDPTGTGRGGESIHGRLYGEQARYYEGEKVPKLRHLKMGTVSMVNCGDNMLGSQFFVTLGQELDYLDEHCVFGEVVEGGDEVLAKFNDTICDAEHKPYQDIRITHTVVLDDPFDDPETLDIPPSSPEPTEEHLTGGRIAPDEEIDDYKGKSIEEIEEIIQDKEAKARATILEMVGDIPDAEVAPPENVLFVCKLNPVTNDDELEIIFNRFGTIKSCEIIRDKKTGDSLQYAFIEFEERKACEDAYFKMDNVLIDDRRIHVDFSQSVAKYRWKGKGRGVEVDNSQKDPATGKQGQRPQHQQGRNSWGQRGGRRGSPPWRRPPESRPGRGDDAHRERQWSPPRNRGRGGVSGRGRPYPREEERRPRGRRDDFGADRRRSRSRSWGSRNRQPDHRRGREPERQDRYQRPPARRSSSFEDRHRARRHSPTRRHDSPSMSRSNGRHGNGNKFDSSTKRKSKKHEDSGSDSDTGKRKESRKRHVSDSESEPEKKAKKKKKRKEADSDSDDSRRKKKHKKKKKESESESDDSDDMIKKRKGKKQSESDSDSSSHKHKKSKKKKSKKKR